MAKRVSVINFKGGVGKTTLAFQFAAGLVRFHAPCRVLLIDVDHQSSLSIVCLGASEWTEAVGVRRTINGIFESFMGSSSLPGTEIIINHPLQLQHGWVYGAAETRYEGLDLAAASLQLDDIEIELTASHRGNAIDSEWEKRTLLCRWIEESGVDSEYDYVIFDCPPATKVVSQNAIAASHGYVVPVVPEAVMERGAPHLVEMMKNRIDRNLQKLAANATHPRSAHVPDTSLIGLVITRIDTHGPADSGYTDDHTQHLGSLQRRWGNSLVQPYIEKGTGISQAMAQGIPVYSKSHTQNIGGRGIHRLFQRLTEELKARIDAL